MHRLRKLIFCLAQIVFSFTIIGIAPISAFSQRASTTSLQTAGMTLGRREMFARPLLLHAEESAAKFGPPARTFLLYRAAGGWLALDKAHAIGLYREAFYSARKLEPGSLRPYVEEAILNDLLPLSPRDVLDLLPSTGPKTQDRLYRAVINFSIMQSDYATAVHTFDEACTHGYFTERSPTYLIANLSDIDVLIPPFVSSEALRTHVFDSAFQAYQRRAPSEIEPWTASRLIARFQKDFPAEVVLPAVDIVLKQAAKKDELHPVGSGGAGYGGNNLSYDSRYDLELFVVAPALQRLAPDRAASLLAEHPKVAADLKRFPKGLLSVDLRESYPTSYRLKGPSTDFMPNGLQLYNSEKGAHSTGLSPMDLGLEFTNPFDLNIGLGATGTGVFSAKPGSPESEIYKANRGCTGDLEQSLTLARSVPLTREVPTTCGGPTGRSCNYEEEFPRVNLLEAIAQSCTISHNRPSADAVLGEEMELVSQMEPEKQTGYLAMAADQYLRLGDRAAAAAVVKRGFDTANRMLQREMGESGLKDVPKAVWPAAESYRRMITLGVNASLANTEDMVGRIADPSLRELEEIMVARALLGVPVRRYMIQYPKGSFIAGEVDISYDQF